MEETPDKDKTPAEAESVEARERLSAQAKALPKLPGVYRFYDGAGNLLYVGKASKLANRVSSYFHGKTSERITLMVSKARRLETSVTRSETEALLLESNLIKTYRPRYNIVFRDDKTYPYLRVSSEKFPRISYYRGSTDDGARYFGPYPSAHAVRGTIRTLESVFLLRTCEDSVFKNRSRPCLLHQIGRCSAPCTGKITEQAYHGSVESAVMFLEGRSDDVLSALKEDMARYAAALEFEEAAAVRNRIAALSRVLEQQSIDSVSSKDCDVLAVVSEGGAACVNLAMVRGGRHLGDRNFFPDNAAADGEHDVLAAFLAQHYSEKPVPAELVSNVDLRDDAVLGMLAERAGKKIRFVCQPRDAKRAWLDMAVQNARFSLAGRLGESTVSLEKARELCSLVSPDTDPETVRIEAFDISHSSGEDTIASCVVFASGKMQNSLYRRYGISGITPGDDYAAMRQVLSRRYSKSASGETELPDIVLIDGGPGQVEVARDVFASLGLPLSRIVGIAKGEGRKVGLETLVFCDGREPVEPGLHSPALMLLAQVRDEAHRFAVAGMRMRRDKKRSASRLEEIDGVGPARRKKLLERFGSMRAVASASVEDLASVEGISLKLAQQIYRQMH